MKLEDGRFELRLWDDDEVVFAAEFSGGKVEYLRQRSDEMAVQYGPLKSVKLEGIVTEYAQDDSGHLRLQMTDYAGREIEILLYRAMIRMEHKDFLGSPIRASRILKRDDGRFELRLSNEELDVFFTVEFLGGVATFLGQQV